VNLISTELSKNLYLCSFLWYHDLYLTS